MMLDFVPRCTADLPPLPGLPGWLSALLRARGARSAEEADRFLHPSLEDLEKPSRMQDMETAVSLIRKAVSAGERIMVYGDYDVDGTAAAAILVEALRLEGAQVSCRIPSRHEDGYGLNERAVREIAGLGVGLLITVDCGITSTAEVDLARSLGMRVIVTDHHELPETLPGADAVLNPLLGDYPFRRLCGAGVALKLCQALRGMEGVRRCLDLAALATVADVVPLTGENRVIVREGLRSLSETARPGLRALMDAAGVRPPLRAEDLAFRLAPRINAAGRLGDATQAVVLFLTQDPGRAARIAAGLEESNRLRQTAERRILTEARRQAEESFDPVTDRVLIAQGEDWNPGLIGLAAGRLCEERHLPAVVLSVRGEEAVGSCRSIPGVSIIRFLNVCGDLFTRCGGHEQAAGLTIPVSRIPELRRRLNAAVRSAVADSVFRPVREYDLCLPLSLWSPEALSLLDALEPTGCGNPAPVFLLSGAEALDRRRVGRDLAHLKLRLQDAEGTCLDAIAFSLGEAAEWPGTRMDALYTPSLDTYGGRTRLQLAVRALRPAGAGS